MNDFIFSGVFNSLQLTALVLAGSPQIKKKIIKIQYCFMFFIVTPFQKVALPASLRDLLILAESNFENKSKRQNFILCCKILRNLLLLSPANNLT
jgi:hypothetical protein